MRSGEYEQGQEDTRKEVLATLERRRERARRRFQKHYNPDGSFQADKARMEEFELTRTIRQFKRAWRKPRARPAGEDWLS